MLAYSTGSQVARNLTVELWGFLSPGQYLIHDRDGKYCPAFQRLIDEAGVTRVPLPPRSPNLHAYAERWVRSLKEETTMELSAAQIQAIENGEAVPISVGETRCILLRADLYARVKALLDLEATYPLLDETFREGWDAPGMADYDRYDELKPQ